MDYWVKIFPVLWDGFTVSLSVYVLTLMFAMPLGMGIGLLADLVPSLRKPITVFTWLFRGTPLLLQLYLTMYGIPLVFSIRMDRFVAGTVTFIVNYAAYYTEIFRSGLAIIPVGQWQAGTVLGLKKWQTVWYVILPTMFRNTLLPLINEAITLVKDTSLLAAIAIGEMLRAAREIVSLDLRVDAYVMAGIFYLAFSLIVVWIGKRFEKKLLVQR